MTVLDDEITALKDGITRYQANLKKATIQEEKNRLSDLITSGRDTFDRDVEITG